MVVFGFVDISHVFFHRFPVFVHDGLVAKLFPDGPGYNDTGVGPAEPHHVARFSSILCSGRHAGISARLALCVADVAQPLVEKLVGVGKERARFGKHLRVGHPPQTLVALRAVGGNGEVVGALSPDYIRDKFVDRSVACCDGAGFHLFRNGGDGNGLDRFDAHLVCRRHRHVAVAVERGVGIVSHVVTAVGKGVDKLDGILVHAQVLAVHAPFGAVHAAASGAVTVVEQFAGQAGEYRAAGCLEFKGRNGGAVLTKVHHKRFARFHRHHFVPGKFFDHDHFSEFLAFLLLAFAFFGAFHAFPYIGLHGREREVGAQIDFSAGRGKYLTGEFGVFLRCGQIGPFLEAHWQAGVVLFAVEDARMLYRACNAGFPVVKVSAEALPCAVGIGQFEHAAESAFLSYHAFVSAGGDDAVAPPAGGHLCGQLVFVAGLGIEHFGDIVSERALGLPVVGEAGLEHFLAYALAVHIEFIHAEARRHPFGRLYPFPVLYRRCEPAGSVGGTLVVAAYLACYHRGIGCREPLRNAPRRVVERVGEITRFGGVARGAPR